MSDAFEVHHGSAPAGWDELVGRLGGSVFHTSIWADYQRKTSEVKPLFLLVRDRSGKERAGAFALFRRSRRPIASLIFRELSLPAHPFGPGDAVANCVAACERVARDLGCSRMSIESFMSADSAFVPSEHGYTESRRVEFSLDLTRDLDSLWKGIGKDQRERIRRHGRQSVRIEEGVRQEDLQGLRLAREATQARRSRRGQGYELPVDEGFYAALYECLVKRGAARFFVARQGDEALAALFFATFGGRAYSVFSGSTERGYELGTQGGLFWTAVETFKAEGFHELNRGGVPVSAENEADPLHGIYLFKKRLGTTPRLCRSGSKVLSRVRDGLTRLRDDVRAWMGAER